MVLSASVVFILMLCMIPVIAQMPLFKCFVRTYFVTRNFRAAYVDIDYSNQSCSFKQLEDIVSKAAEISCAETSKVALRIIAPFEGFYRMNCSAAFPLDLRLETENEWDPKVTFIKSGYEYVVDMFGILYDTSAVSGNFKIFSAHNDNLSITIELSITPNMRVPKYPEMGISVERKNDSTAPKIVCEVHVRGRAAMIFGWNPTQTQVLLKCLLPQRFDCLWDVYAGNSFVNAAPDVRKHGMLLCSNRGIEKTMHYFSPVNSCDVLDISSIWDDKNVIRMQMDDSRAIFVVPRLHDAKEVFKDAVTFYESDFLSLECHFLKYAMHFNPVTWVLKYENGTEQAFSRSVDVEEEKHCQNENRTIFSSKITETSSHVRIKGRAGMVAIECRAYYWNFNKTARAAVSVTIKGLSEAKAPTFVTKETELETAVGSSLSLVCGVAVADPEPEYSWKFEPLNPAASNESSSFILPKHPETVFPNGTRVSTLKLQQFVPSMEGKYTCSAENVRGSAKRIFNITIHKGVTFGTTTSIWQNTGIGIGITALIGMLAVGFSRKYFLKKGHLTAMEIKLFEEGDAKKLRSDQYAHENSQFMPYDKGYEIKWSDFKIYNADKLGQGEFGIVFKGCLVSNPSHTIAIKTTKAGADRVAILALLSELKVMIHLESHENVVKLVGACTEFLKEGRLYIIVEYCQAGSMDSYLRRLDKKIFAEMHLNCSHTRAIQESNLSYEAVDYLATKDMIGWAIQIARGMQHLESKKVIHGDLATRNILLYSKSRVMITDFGLSRQLLNYENYVKKSQTKLPWRWLALETLKSLTFSHKSDVWAYGVTLWEIFTLGLVPYPGMNWTTEFVLHLEDNLRLYQPKFATDNLYKIMMQCWDADPGNRPSFQQIEEALLALSKQSKMIVQEFDA